MTLDIKGSIKFDPDVKPSEPKYTIECKSPEFCIAGSGNLTEMIDELAETVRARIQQEFGRDSFIEVLSYSMNLTLGVSGIVNRTLAEFVDAPAKTEETGQ